MQQNQILQDNEEQHIQSLLGVQEQAVKHDIPSELLRTANNLPSPSVVFGDYIKTKNPSDLFKAKAALDTLQSYASGSKDDTQASPQGILNTPQHDLVTSLLQRTDNNPQPKDATSGKITNPKPTVTFTPGDLGGDITITSPDGRTIKANSSTGEINPYSLLSSSSSGVSNPVDSMFTAPKNNSADDQKSVVPETVPKTYQSAVYNAASKTGISGNLIAAVLHRENPQGIADATNVNKNGTVDHGLMQINTVNLPSISKYFASQGQTFDWKNPSQSIEAAAVILKGNYNQLKTALGREPTEKELFTSYNLGVGGTIKAIQGDTYKQGLASHYTSNMFQ